MQTASIDPALHLRNGVHGYLPCLDLKNRPCEACFWTVKGPICRSICSYASARCGLALSAPSAWVASNSACSASHFRPKPRPFDLDEGSKEAHLRAASRRGDLYDG